MREWLLTGLYMILTFLLVVFILAFAFRFVQSATAQYSRGIPFEWRVVDGDTISTIKRPRLYFRLAGFDTPEITRPRCDAELLAGTKAKRLLADLLASPDLVWLNTQTFDKYGRALVYVWVKGKKIETYFLNANLGVRSNGKTRFNWCAHLKAQAKH